MNNNEKRILKGAGNKIQYLSSTVEEPSECEDLTKIAKLIEKLVSEV